MDSHSDPMTPTEKAEREAVLIRSGEHGAWWRHGGHGYTDNTFEAGVFTAEEAERIVRGCGPEKMLMIRPLLEVAPVIEPNTVASVLLAREALALREREGELVEYVREVSRNLLPDYIERLEKEPMTHMGYGRSIMMRGERILARYEKEVG